MSSVKVHSKTFPAIFSGRLREATAPFSHVFTPQAPGSQPISGRNIFCNPNPFYPHILFYRSSPPFCVLVEILCHPNLGRDYFPPVLKVPPLPPSPDLFSNPTLDFFAPNLNLYLALLSAILLTNIFLLLWWDWLFLIHSNLTGITDKGKPFERMGRKTTDLSNGGWVAELRSRISLAHSFEVKTGLFFMRNPGGHQEVNHEHPTESCDQAHRA